MTLNTPSRVTFADLLATVRTAPMAERRRQDIASAVKTIARLLGHSPAEIPLDLPALNMRLKHVSPQAMGISEARWHNVRSLLRAALALNGPVMKGRQIEPLSPDWEKLQRLIGVRGDRIKLSRLLRWLSANNIVPENLTEAGSCSFSPAAPQNSSCSRSRGHLE